MAKSRRHDVAAATLLAFSALLRGGEVLALKRKDVALAGDPRLSSFAASRFGGVHIRTSKTGNNQFSLHHNYAEVELRVHLSSRPAAGSARVFAFTVADWRATLEAALLAIGVSLPDRRITIHSLRHSGALDMLFNGHAMADVVFAGRWPKRQLSCTSTALLPSTWRLSFRRHRQHWRPLSPCGGASLLLRDSQLATARLGCLPWAKVERAPANRLRAQ